jgi:imidazolonepropionase-like amidohydrolase
VLARVLEQQIPLQIEAHRVPDILNALRLKDEFDISLVLLGCSEGYKVAGEIAKRDVSVIVAPVSLSFTDPSKFRYGAHSRENAAGLADAGVQVALGVGGSQGLHSKFVRACAAMAVANGLDRDVALKAVTANAAEVLGIADRVGSIAVGRDADIVIIDGDPLDVRAAVELVIQDGEVVFEMGAAD